MTNPEISPIKNEKLVARKSILVETNRSTSPGFNVINMWLLHCATSSPTAPPTSDSNSDSVNKRRRILPRPAPSDRRIAFSFRRRSARARSKLAILAQAMSSTRPAAPQGQQSRLSQGGERPKRAPGSQRGMSQLGAKIGPENSLVLVTGNDPAAMLH